MRKKSVFNQSGLSPLDFTKDFISKVMGMSHLEYTSFVKPYSTADFRLILDTLGIEHKVHEGRIILLMKTYNTITNGSLVNPN